MKRAVICLSGGMDSTGLLTRLIADGYFITGLSFDYGQKHKLELERLEQNLRYLEVFGMKNSIPNMKVDHHIVELNASGKSLGAVLHSALCTRGWEPPEGHYEQDNMKETVVPNRNMIFASIAFGVALSIAVEEDTTCALALGVHSGDHEIYPDCRPEFYEKLITAFRFGNWDSEKVDLLLPYIDGDKVTILKDARNAIETFPGLEFDTIFANTNTSYAPDSKGRASGKTGSDVERILAFNELGLRDPVEYRGGWESALENALRLKKEAEGAEV